MEERNFQYQYKLPILLTALIDVWKNGGKLPGVAVYGDIPVDVEWKKGHLYAV